MKIPVGLARPGKCSPLRCPPSLGRGTCLLAGLHFATLPHPNNQRHLLAAALRGLMCTAATVNLCEPPVPAPLFSCPRLPCAKELTEGEEEQEGPAKRRWQLNPLQIMATAKATPADLFLRSRPLAGAAPAWFPDLLGDGPGSRAITGTLTRLRVAMMHSKIQFNLTFGFR